MSTRGIEICFQRRTHINKCNLVWRTLLTWFDERLCVVSPKDSSSSRGKNFVVSSSLFNWDLMLIKSNMPMSLDFRLGISSQSSFGFYFFATFFLYIYLLLNETFKLIEIIIIKLKNFFSSHKISTTTMERCRESEKRGN